LSATQHNVESPNQEQILATVADLLEAVIGDEYELDIEVTMETSFSDDIELESIEFVRLSELLQQQYGRRVDFVSWFSGLDVDQIIALRVGELVEFIHAEVGGIPDA
jgi:acyl carrier protein